MALRILQPGIQPLGQFDLADAYMNTILGGEIGAVWAASRINTATEKASFDARQGITNLTDQKRLVVAPYLSQNGLRPLWLLDDGSVGYGTLFGQSVATALGVRSTGFGPQTR